MSPPVHTVRAQPAAYAARRETFDDVRHQAFGDLGDVLDLLLSDFPAGREPNAAQALAVARARQAIAEARAARDEASRARS